MSLINCPECGKEISDKVKACPNCGFPLVEEQVVETPNLPQQVELTKVNLGTKNYKKPLMIVAAVLVLGIVLFLGIRYLNQQKEKNAFEESFNNYVDTLSLIRLGAIAGGAEAEKYTNLVASVWNNTIREERDSTTDKYTRPDGFFVEDFNDALHNLIMDSSSISTIASIKNNQTAVQELMKLLQSPPVGLERCYDTVTEMYSAYLGITELAVNPKGSLNSFNEERRQKIDAFLDAYNRLESQIPDKIGSTTADN